jgi:hypothetical protein
MCAAPKKNRFWLARSSHGREKIFSSAQVLETSCFEYFESVISNPLKEQKVFSNGKKTTVNLMRPFTLKGLFIFLDIHRKTWDRYKAFDDYCAIMERIEDIIYTQKFDGAAVGLLKENIISRELGLADKQDIGFENLSDEQLIKLSKEIISNGTK